MVRSLPEGRCMVWLAFFTPAISQPNLVTTFLSGVMVTPNSRSEAAGVILGQARSMVRSLPEGRCMVWLAFLEEESKSTVAFSSPLNQKVLVGPALVTFMDWTSGRLVSILSSLPGVCQADTIISSWPVMSLVMGKRPLTGWLNQTMV